MSFAATAIGVAGSVAGGMIAAQGGREQAGAIVNGQLVGRETALELDNRARADMAPFRDLGLTAGNQLEQIIAGNAKLDDLFKGSSLYDWQSEMGTRGINRQLKARGMYNSGAGLETLAMFEKGLVAEEGAKWWDKLFNTAALGSNAAARMATGTTQTGATLADLGLKSSIAQGDAVANQYNALGGAVAGGLGSVAQSILYKPYLDKLASGGTRSSAPEMDFDPSVFSKQ